MSLLKQTSVLMMGVAGALIMTGPAAAVDMAALAGVSPINIGPDAAQHSSKRKRDNRRTSNRRYNNNYGYNNGYYNNNAYRYNARNDRYRDYPVTRNTRVWRGRDGRVYCKKKDGTTGLIVGGALGALLGNYLDGGRERVLGTVLGGAGGALLGREIDRGGSRCR